MSKLIQSIEAVFYCAGGLFAIAMFLIGTSTIFAGLYGMATLAFLPGFTLLYLGVLILVILFERGDGDELDGSHIAAKPKNTRERRR